MNVSLKVLKRMSLAFLLLISSAVSSLSKMTYLPTHVVEISSLINLLQKKNNLSQGEREQLILLTLANDLGEVKKVRVSGEKGTDIKIVLSTLKSKQIESALEDQLNSNTLKYWKYRLTGKNRSIVLKEKSVLIKELGEDSYLWAWFLSGLNQRMDAREVLEDLFEKEFSRIMSLQRVPFQSFRKGPFHRLNLYLQGLKEFVTKDEFDQLNEKLRKAKVHMSAIPDNNVMT